MNKKFDRYLERRGTGSVKWDSCQAVFGTNDVLPMWVADSDWSAPEEVIEALKERIEHGAFGYTRPDEDVNQTVVDWVERRYGWKINASWLVYTSGVVPAINVAVRAYTCPGDEVVIQSPVYYPFFSAVRDNGAQLVNNQLKLTKDGYTIDFEDLKKQFQDDNLYRRSARVKLLILCSPHNPVGRVWTEEELRELGEICLENDVLVVSDEIHADLIYNGQKHISFGSLSKEFAMNSLTMIAPSKTFNIAGLHTSVIIIPDPHLRKKFKEAMGGLVTSGNVLGYTALKAAYSQGEDWLEEQLAYLEKNRDYALDFIEKKIPGIDAIKPEGTYLLWLDCRSLNLSPEELNNFMVNKARVGLDAGTWFGPGGEGFMRLNMACPRSLLKDGLQRIARAVQERFDKGVN